ncbi:WD40 repeat domain-containing protein [Streptomyces sp. C11-1]|uniref:WD40 repeat domain-containing protein n=1 Tax=Streptomyces durocortorensis TaxID=2811104 RepID=A0ABY9VXF1_9ACTN|nr:WD40 repeat domain-containing protein [Streptomyces durocortorensis]WNF28393.1 WD40 repeat domain-containing protein [Streptomyces durocortorensis]
MPRPLPPPSPGDLATPGAHAILVGTGHHATGSELPDLPSVDTTLDDLQRVLHAVCGMAEGRVHRVPADARPEDVVAIVERVVGEATGVVLLLYAGHGLLGPDDELYLATRTSRSAGQVSGAVPYHTLKGLLGRAAGGSAVVLDCCFSGRATVPDGSDRQADPFVSVRPGGSFLLSSASYFAPSYAPEGERHTLFGGQLLELLTSGDPSGPPQLTLDHLHTALARTFSDGPIHPRRQSEGTLDRLVLAPNAAYSAAPGPDAAPPADVPCPYPGMKPFPAEETGYFHGRDALADHLTALVVRDDPSPLVLVGASGVGKSSLLRAGLLARLERRPEAWPALLLPAPGPHPMRTLAGLWARATGRDPKEVRATLDRGRFPPPPRDRPVCRLLIVDQFEEVFTRCRDSGERARFITLLTSPHQDGPRIVLSLRADHYGSCLDHPGLVRALDHHRLNVTPMTEDDLRAAVEHPAEAAGLSLQAGLTDRLLHDLRGGPAGQAGLPFLAHALRETWLRRSGAALTLAGYQATGGIWRSVTTTTDKLYEDLDGAGRTALRKLLLRMVHVSPDASQDATRRRIRIDELSSPVSERRLLDRLVDARLVTLDQDSAQISHEALLRAWDQLRDWIDEDRTELVLRRRIADDTDAWEAAGRDQTYLYRGTRLQSARDLLDRGRLDRALDSEFLHAGARAAGAEREREARRTRRLKRTLQGAVLALCAALVATGIAYQQRSNARANGETAQNRQLQASARANIGTDPRSALLLAVAAYRGAPSPQSRRTLMDVLAATQYAGSADATGGVDSLTYSDDGRTLAVGGGTGVVGLWDTSGPGEPAELADVVTEQSLIGWGNPAVWIGDGRSLLLTGADQGASLGRFSLTDRSRPQPRGRMPLRLRESMEASEFSPDGRTLVISTAGETRLWSVVAGRGSARARASLPQRESNVKAIAFGPDSAVLALGWQDGTVELWDVEDPDRPRSLGVLDGTGGPVRALAISRDGRTLAVASSDAQVRLWDVARPADARRTAVISGHGGPVESVALSGDGRLLATGSTDHTATLWSISPGGPVRSAVFTGHDSTVSALAFSPDGRTLASGDGNDSVLFWSLTDRLAPTVAGRPVAPPARDYYRWFEDGIPYALAPEGRLLAGATAERELSLIPLTGRSAGRPAGVIRIDGPGHLTYHGQWFSADGDRLAVEGPGGTVTLWNVKDPGHPVREFRLNVAPSSNRGLSLAFSAQGDLMAVGTERGVTLWDLSSPGRPRRLSAVRTRTGIPVVLFAPKGRILAVGSALYDVTDPRTPERLSDLPDPDSDSALVYAAPYAFAPDGRTLVMGKRGGILFDVSDPRRPRFLSRLRNGSGEGPYSFGGDGRLLTGSGSGAQVLVWDVSDPAAPHAVTSLTLGARAQALAVSSDGAFLTTYESPGTTTRWKIAQLSTALRDPVALACRLAAANPTAAEWAAIAPGVPFRRVCPGLAAAPAPSATGPFSFVFPTPIPAGT